jgi:alpha-tubulin suppressor-like RCC1 family protein
VAAAGAPHVTTPRAITPAAAGTVYTPVAPQRLLDTRTTGVKIAAGNGIELELRNDLQNTVPPDATAVVLNVTGTDSTGPTFLTVSPLGDNNLGSVSSLNLAAHETRANLVTAAIGTSTFSSGELLIAGPSALDVVVDLEGYYTPSGGMPFTSIAPLRVLDTRSGTGQGGRVAPVGPKAMITLDLSTFVPPGTTSVVFNLTGTNPTAPTFVTAWPSGTLPTASNLNLVAHAVTPNLVTVGLSADRTVNLYNFAGSIDLIADLAGYYSPGSTQSYFPLTPIRVLDTRDANGNPRIPLGQGATTALDLSGWVPSVASSAVFNLTGTNVTAGTFVTTWPAGGGLPLASNLNLVPGQTSANQAVVALGGGGVNLRNLSGRVDLIVDLAGYFAPSIPACTTGCVYGIGTDSYGRLGNATTTDTSQTATRAFGVSYVTAVSGSDFNGYALRSDGTVWSWGINAGGALGNGKAGSANVPGLNLSYFSSAVPVQVSGLSNVIAIAGSHALRSDGTVWSWGSNYMWELGDGNKDDTAVAKVPVQVTGLTGVVAIAEAIGSGYALKSDGTVWSWGQNIFGELGTGTSGNDTVCSANGGVSPVEPNCASAVPVQVAGLTGVTAIGIARAAKSDGTVWRWGPRNFSNQDNAPVLMSGISNVKQFATAEVRTDYALLADGTVRAWGYNNNGSWGDGESCAPGATCYTDTPVTVSGLSGVTAISAGLTAAYALRSDGTMVAWGGGQNGELGNGNEFSISMVPVKVPGLAGVTAIGNGGFALVPNP